MSALFSPIRIKHTEFRNRVVMPPMVMGLADAQGRVSEAVVEHYARRARAGTGLIVVEATAVHEGGRCWTGGLGAYSDEHIAGLTQLAEAIHLAGAVADIQLVHGGPQASADLVGETVGPSAVRPSEKATLPRALSAHELKHIQECFADAAARAVEAGFDIVEVHGAHGYLIDSFLSTQRNVRTDDHGGSLAGRMRMLVETCRRVRERIGHERLLDCRISLFNKRDEEFSADDLGELVRGLEGAGIDLLHVSTDGAFKGYFGGERTLGQWVKGITSLPIIVAGALGNPADAERAVAEGHCDLAAVGHGMLEDPEWALHAHRSLV